MTTNKAAKSTGKTRKTSTSKSAKPAKTTHKKVGLARKVAPRKTATKHTTKAKAPSVARSDDQYMKYSGKFTVRLPKSLHQELVQRAEREGVSLNLFVTNALSRTVGYSGKGKR